MLRAAEVLEPTLPCPHAEKQRSAAMISVMVTFNEILDIFVCIRAGNDYLCRFAFGSPDIWAAKIRKNKP
jgi:hypothetical protein